MNTYRRSTARAGRPWHVDRGDGSTLCRKTIYSDWDASTEARGGLCRVCKAAITPEEGAWERCEDLSGSRAILVRSRGVLVRVEVTPEIEQELRWMLGGSK